MKICTVCGTENESDRIRCTVCHTLLPDVEISSSLITVSEAITVRICDKCSAVCNKNAVRCDKCGSFLSAERRYSEGSSKQAADPLTVRLDTGETLVLTHGQIIGRQYQSKIWDAYTPKAAFMIVFDNGRYCLKNLKDSSMVTINFGDEYMIGRKRVVFSDK